jgi:hypothetical protein
MQYWWCLKHSRVERDDEVDTKGDDRVGPYPTQERAENWRDEFQARNERWDREDAEWEQRGHRPGEG